MVNAEASGSSTKLPPGMILGPDGKPCRACSSATAFASGFKKALKKPAAAATLAVPLTLTKEEALPTDECPADTEQLGRHTWTFLHTAAAYYPMSPSPQHKLSMTSLLNSLPLLYPCSTCADELGEYMKENPVGEEVVKGRASLEKWMCDVHNEVNGRLGKSIFDCGKVGERWREGWKDGRCD